MIFFKGFFGKKDTIAPKPVPSATVSASAPVNDLIEIPAFIPTDPNEYELVSVIATAIAAGDHPKSQFVVKNIMKRNPEAHLVSLISASIAAGTMPESKFVVKKISQVK